MTERRTVFGVLDDMAKHAALIATLSTLAAVGTSVIVLVMPATYASSASFVPESQSPQRLPASVAGLASQLGVNLMGEPSHSPAFYADLLRSREVLQAVLAAKVPGPKRGIDSISVADLYRIKGKAPELRLENGVKELRNHINVAVDQRTGIVRLAVEARGPSPARDVARLLLQQLAAFNLDTRQSLARNRRVFIEGRVSATARDLELAEDALRDFYERNRQWQSSPQLRFEEQRLTRQVNVQQDLYLTLRREFETARIEEVNTVPVVTLVDEPQIPGRRVRPKRTFTVAVVTLVVFILACGLAIALERHRELLESGQPEYRRLYERLRKLLRQQPSSAAAGR
jgi:uncharacterized protein involved in exopolysaccharide biosynthesis